MGGLWDASQWGDPGCWLVVAWATVVIKDFVLSMMGVLVRIGGIGECGLSPVGLDGVSRRRVSVEAVCGCGGLERWVGGLWGFHM